MRRRADTGSGVGWLLALLAAFVLVLAASLLLGLGTFPTPQTAVSTGTSPPVTPGEGESTTTPAAAGPSVHYPPARVAAGLAVAAVLLAAAIRLLVVTDWSRPESDGFQE